MRRLILVFSLLVLLSLACNLPGLASAPQVQVVDPAQIVTPDPNATVTPTPFQPLALTPTLAEIAVQSTATEAPSPTPGGSVADSGEIIHNLKMPDGQMNIMVLGSDYRPGGGSRTDVIMLVSLNTNTSVVSIISFPRDTYVYLPGRGMDRLNTAYAYEGFPLLADTMEYNFGVRPDHYMITNFYGFKAIINTLGGLNVYVGAYLRDKCDLPARDWEGYCSVAPGSVLMDGDTALWYVRSRYSTSDLDRTRREQEVLEAFFRRLMSLNAVSRAPELFNLFISSVETDLKLDDLLPIVVMAPKLLSDDSLIHRHLIGIDMLTPYVTDAGAQVLIPDKQAIWELIKNEVYGQ
jgi:LCP family protein required for cell wall assembly